jgi:hypothetical protein
MLSELDAFFELYTPKLDDGMFQGSGGSALAVGDDMSVIEPSVPPNDSPAESDSGNAEGSDVCGRTPYDPNLLAPEVLNASRPYVGKAFAPNGARRSDSADQNEPSLVSNATDGGAREACAVDDIFSLDDVRSSSSSSICPRISLSDSERESAKDRSFREELGPGIGTSSNWEGDLRGGVAEDGSSGIGGGADSERSVGGGMNGAWKGLGAGICRSCGFCSDLPITSLIAVKLNPAVLGIFDRSGVPMSP